MLQDILHCKPLQPQGEFNLDVLMQYKRTGRWEAHIWDSSDPGAKKGRQLHLGSFPAADPAAM